MINYNGIFPPVPGSVQLEAGVLEVIGQTQSDFALEAQASSPSESRNELLSNVAARAVGRTIAEGLLDLGSTLEDADKIIGGLAQESLLLIPDALMRTSFILGLSRGIGYRIQAARFGERVTS